jgi:hypothetical protein
MAGIMAANSLNGEALMAWIVKVGGWCKVTRALYDTLKFFANDQLYNELIERQNGDEGRRLYLLVGTGERQVHLSQQPGVAKELARNKAEVAAIKIAEAQAEADRVNAEADRKAGNNKEEDDKPEDMEVETPLSCLAMTI